MVEITTAFIISTLIWGNFYWIMRRIDKLERVINKENTPPNEE